jgi:hypothetical protein
MHVRELEHRKVTEKTFSDILFWTLLEVTVVMLLVRCSALDFAAGAYAST